MKDYYRILEVHEDASLEVITKAYRALAQKYHPDHFHASDKTLANQRMEALNEAYQVLSDPVARAAYNRQRRQVAPTPPSKPLDLQRLLTWCVLTIVVLLVLQAGAQLLVLLGGGLRWLLVLALLYGLYRWQQRRKTP